MQWPALYEFRADWRAYGLHFYLRKIAYLPGNSLEGDRQISAYKTPVTIANSGYKKGLSRKLGAGKPTPKH